MPMIVLQCQTERSDLILRYGNPELDQNGDPIVKHFSDKDRNDLQRIAWKGFNEFIQISLP